MSMNVVKHARMVRIQTQPIMFVLLVIQPA